MKKSAKVILATLFLMAVLVSPAVLFAQDSTAVGGGADVDIFQTILEALSAKWTIVATIGTILFFISEGLSYIKSVDSNGIFQLVHKVLKAVFSKKS